MATTRRSSKGVVYVVRIVDGFHAGSLKVGFTQNLDRRLKQLHGELIASAPGSFVQEQHLLSLCPREHRMNPRWREWFTDAVLEVLAPAWERMFGVDLAVRGAV